ncbi:MAG: hypothetical protein FWE83_02810 [Oscillospiraceae bacterium]|nr:hypothetical protein [Oscillospiraceae bacterium]
MKTLTMVLMVIIVLIGLLGCTKSPEENDNAYDNLLEQYNQIISENNLVGNEVDSLRGEVESLAAKNAEMQQEIEGLSNDVTLLSSQLNEKTIIVNEQNEQLNEQNERLIELQPYLELSREEVELRRESLNRQQVLDDLDAEIEAKQDELDRLVTRIKETGEAPITLGAGEYRSPDDIPPGRYTVTGRSNFVVYNSRDRLQVNTILGGRHGEDSYTFFLDSGSRIEARGRFTLTPVE